jgi:hypothetical protein
MGQIKALLLSVLLYVRAPGNIHVFYNDLDGKNDFSTRRLLIFEGLTIFSILFSPLIFIHRYVVDTGFFTYLFLVLVSMAIYGIGFPDRIRQLTRWQHDRACWFPEFMVKSGVRKFGFGLVFLVAQVVFVFFVHIVYMNTRAKYAL